MSKKRIKEEDRYWQHKPGFNWLLGYCEGKGPAKTGGVKEVSIDRSVKDGKSLNK